MGGGRGDGVFAILDIREHPRTLGLSIALIHPHNSNVLHQTNPMSEYTEIKKVGPNPHEFDVNHPLANGWVLIGIEQKRDVHENGSFDDETVYILGKKAEM